MGMTIQERVERIDLRYGRGWDRGVRAYIEGEFRLAEEQAVAALRADLEAVAVAALELNTVADLLANDDDLKDLGYAVDAMMEALARPGVQAVLAGVK